MTSEKKRNIWFLMTIFFSVVYLLWRIFFTLPWSAGFLQAAAGLALVLAETVTFLGMAELMAGRMKSSRYEIHLPEVPPERFPDVDVFIATHNESAKLLYKTVNACTFLEYPDKGKFIFMCVMTETGRKSGSLRRILAWGIWGFQITSMPSQETTIMLFPARFLR